MQHQAFNRVTQRMALNRHGHGARRAACWLMLLSFLLSGVMGCDARQKSPSATDDPSNRAVKTPSDQDGKTAADNQPTIALTGNPFLLDEPPASADPLSLPSTAEQRRMAVNQIAAEAVKALHRRRVLLVWLLDRTTIAHDQVAGVTAELQQVYGTFDSMAQQGHEVFRQHEGQPLLSSVVAFGNEAEFLLPAPTANGAEVTAALAKLGTDESGTENTFSAIGAVLEKYSSLQTEEQRHLIIAVVTNEVGDDQQKLDSLLSQLNERSIPVHVIGTAAPFGSKEGLSAVAEIENWQPVQQGPESLFPEAVQLESLKNNYEGALIDSGFGPFSLTRLARATEGFYFAIREADAPEGGVSFRPTAKIIRFNPRAMARYAPDYISAKEYEQLLAENKACGALIKAAAMPKVATRGNLQMQFIKRDEASFKREVDSAQQVVARLQPALRQLYDVLAEGEKDREKIDSPRWQAAYDLALGRVLAARARTEGYNSMLAYLKTHSTFANPASTTWMLVEGDEIKGDSALNKIAQRSKSLLQGIVTNHPDTPWAMMAKMELEVPVGWEWTEQ